jgi:hypothetical protein
VSTVDHPDIRGFEPHNRDPSGAASDYERGLGPKTYRIGASRILLFVCSSTATHAASCAPGVIEKKLSSTSLATIEELFLTPPAAKIVDVLLRPSLLWPR